MQQINTRSSGLLAATLTLVLTSVGCAGTIDSGSAQDNDSVGPGAPAAAGAAGSNPTSAERDGASLTAQGETVEPTVCSQELVHATPLRRLSHTEYNKTVASLFPGIQLPKQVFAADLAIHGFENNAAAMNPSPVLVEQYADAAGRIAELAAADLEAVLPCAPSGNDMSCASEFISTFGANAFRRPLSADEQTRYSAFFAQQMGALSFNAAVELTLQAFLVSPQFLYRLELGSGNEQAGQAVQVDDYAMASRLSYVLWQTMPDAELFAAASHGQLHTAAQVEVQARRMLNTPAAEAAIVDFHRQWLDFDRLDEQEKDASLFPMWNDSLKAAAREESNRFVAHVFGEQGTSSVSELLTSKVSFVNGELAGLYGVDVSGSGWQQVTLPTERAGILTRANFLASRAHSTNGSPPLRGVAVLDQLLCSRPPPPPPTANTSAPTSTDGAAHTNRDLFETRTGKSECQGCHKAINGIGYGFEAFDSIGAFRKTDHGLSVDATGNLVSTSDVNGPYNGAVELSTKLAQSTQVEQCAVKNLYRFATAREEKSNDSCKLDALYASMEKSGGNVRELLVSIATSYEFMHRSAVSVN